MRLRFRPTAWPGGEIPLPPIRVWDNLRLHDGGWLELVEPTRKETLPPDFALRELGTERPTTADAAVAFVRQWGRASDPDNRDLAPDQVVGRGQDRARLARRLDLDPHLLVHPDEVLTRAKIMSDLATHIIRSGDELDEDDWLLFASRLNAALSAFQARLDIGVDTELTIPPATAFSVAALQLLNDLAAETPLRRCANETCPHGGHYTRQRDRAKHGEYRTSGTRYCSRSCAKSQGAREHRRRARQTGGAT